MVEDTTKALAPIEVDIDAIMSRLTAKQRQFLSHRPHHEKDSLCCNALNLHNNTPATWRNKSPDFRQAYEYIVSQQTEASHALSRQTAIKYRPLAVLRAAELAVKPSEDLRDREIGTAQKAREYLDKVAGIEQQAPQHTIIFTDLSCVREAALLSAESKKRAGRPKGSKNKPKIIDAEYTVREE